MCFEFNNSRRKIQAYSDGRWQDVTGRSAVIYGTGGDLMRVFALPNVKHIIVSGENRWGRKLTLLGEEYTIEPPSILTSLDWSTHYLVISSTVYEQEITAEIHKYIQEDGKIIVRRWENSLRYCYESLEDMLSQDYRAIAKLNNIHLLSHTKELLAKFNELRDTVFCGVELTQFIYPRGGDTKLTVFFGNEQQQWVLSVPGRLSSKDGTYSLRSQALKCAFVRNYGLNDGLTMYSDDSGFTIQKYAGERLDFTSQARRNEVLRMCAQLHDIKYDLCIEGNMTDRRISEFNRELKRWESFYPALTSALRDNFNKLLERFRRVSCVKCVCHGDIGPHNLVGLDGRIYMVDWDTLCMDDPIYDVTSFLYFAYPYHTKPDGGNELSAVCKKLPEDISFYLGHPCTADELFRASFSILLVSGCRRAAYPVAPESIVSKVYDFTERLLKA